MHRPSPAQRFSGGQPGAHGIDPATLSCAPTTPLSYERYRESRYFPSLDGLRALAILAVIWHHSSPVQVLGVLGRGHLGVRLFFAISGFLITELLLSEARAGQIRLSAFYARRAARLLPLYYVVLLAFTCYAYLLDPGSAQRQHFFQSLPFYLTHTANWFVHYAVGHPILFAFAWSLSAEQQFYALWPPLVALCRRLAPAGYRSWLALIACALIGVDQLAERGLFEVWLPARSVAWEIVTSFIASLGFGALLACLLDEPKVFPWLRALLGQRWSAPLLALAVAGLVVSPPSAFVLFELLLAALVASSALGPQFELQRLLSLPWLRHVGQVSYGMYLLHVPLLGLLRKLPLLGASTALTFSLGAGLSVVVASLVERSFERPIRNWVKQRQAVALTRSP